MEKISAGDAADRIADAERRYEEMRDNYEVEARAAREESRKRKRAEARVEELEAQLNARSRELEEVKEARTRDAQELLANAKERLSVLHIEVSLHACNPISLQLSDTFRTESPADAPEYQKTLEELVASNALLKHDASELSLLLNDSRDEVRVLKEEIDELRAAVGVAGRISPDNLPSSRRLASELLRSHSRTESSPNVGHAIERGSWARMSVHIPSSTRVMEHVRKSSLAPSFTSSSSYNDNMPSPGLGLGPIGEYDGVLVSEGGGALSPPPDGRESPRPIFRSSPSGGIGYVLNGVPKSKTTLPRPPARRATSGDRPRPIRTYSVSSPTCTWLIRSPTPSIPSLNGAPTTERIPRTRSHPLDPSTLAQQRRAASAAQSCSLECRREKRASCRLMRAIRWWISPLVVTSCRQCPRTR